VEAELSGLVDAIAKCGALTELSHTRVAEIASRLGSFLSVGCGLASLGEVRSAHIRSFVTATGTTGPASPGTMHVRRALVRLLFREARRTGIVEGDPTIDLLLPARVDRTARGLTDLEVELCRHASLHTLESTRLAAQWALAETTARPTEIPRLTLGDLDLANRRVWIHGATRTQPRWGELTDWGQAQLARHLECLTETAPTSPIARCNAGSGTSRPPSAVQNLGEVLVRAGLGDESDLEPLSITAWRGREIFAATGRIEVVTRRLGMRSLDRAAQLIGLDWQEPTDDGGAIGSGFG
jgi:integrase